MFRTILVHHQEQPFINCTSHFVYAGTIRVAIATRMVPAYTKVSENLALFFKRYTSVSWNYNWNTTMLIISERTKLGDEGEAGGYHCILFWLFKTSNVEKFPTEYSHVTYVWQSLKLEYKGKAIPLHAYYRLLKFRKFQAPRFQNSRHMNVVRLSALGTSRIYPPGDFPGTHFC